MEPIWYNAESRKKMVKAIQRRSEMQDVHQKLKILSREALVLAYNHRKLAVPVNMVMLICQPEAGTHRLRDTYKHHLYRLLPREPAARTYDSRELCKSKEKCNLQHAASRVGRLHLSRCLEAPGRGTKKLGRAKAELGACSDRGIWHYLSQGKHWPRCLKGPSLRAALKQHKPSQQTQGLYDTMTSWKGRVLCSNWYLCNCL
jgi:hypothetical protein